MSDDDVPLFTIDKEAMVLDLYKQGRRRREIASIVRMNFSDIKTIIDREFGLKEEKKTTKNTDSVYTRALKLFLGKAKPVTVAMKLGLSYEETRKIYLQFLRLNRMHKLSKIYDELGEDGIKPFLLLYNKMQEDNFTLDQIEDAVYYSGSLGELEQMHSALEEDVNELESKRENLVSANQNLENIIRVADRKLECYNYETEMKKQEFLQVSQEVNIKKNFIQNFDNEEGWIRTKEAAKKEIESIMQDKRLLLAIAIGATLEALRRYPASQELVFNLTPGFTNEYQQLSIDAHKNELVELGACIQSEIVEQITKKTTDTMENTVPV